MEDNKELDELNRAIAERREKRYGESKKEFVEDMENLKKRDIESKEAIGATNKVYAKDAAEAVKFIAEYREQMRRSEEYNEEAAVKTVKNKKEAPEERAESTKTNQKGFDDKERCDKLISDFLKIEQSIISSINGEGSVFFTDEQLGELNKLKDKYTEADSAWRQYVLKHKIFKSSNKIKELKEEAEKAKNEYNAKIKDYKIKQNEAQNERKAQRDKILKALMTFGTDGNMSYIYDKLFECYSKYNEQLQGHIEERRKIQLYQSFTKKESDLNKLINLENARLAELTSITEVVLNIGNEMYDKKVAEQEKQVSEQSKEMISEERNNLNNQSNTMKSALVGALKSGVTNEDLVKAEKSAVIDEKENSDKQMSK
ncbi:MAG: hypothetical protein IJH12_05650 [Clostridia bacterium]|nr:hypothetical protein [Clostridia bacterium]